MHAGMNSPQRRKERKAIYMFALKDFFASLR
jgi:hypothetical protein